MGIDRAKLVRDALNVVMGEVGLTYEEEEAEGREEGDGMVSVFTPRVLRLSDGRVFIETMTETINGDDWGSDFYDFVEVGKPFTFTRKEHLYDGNDPHVSTEERLSTFELPDPVIPENNLPEPDNNLPDVSEAHHVLKPEIKFGVPEKTFTPDEIREQGGEFGDSIAEFMENTGIETLAFEAGDEEEDA